MAAGGLLVAGTTSDAGKSTVTAGLCRWLARRGLRVAPFKAQNMSNNSMVCHDGAEIGRAQWLQAVAAGAPPESAMNPVLLKPGDDRRSHVVLRGRPSGTLGSAGFPHGRRMLAEAAYDALAALRGRFDVVVCEGAGSPAEINLRDGDYVNMGLARQAGLPVVVVGDIDRGGVLASMTGTLALLDRADQELVAGFVVNKFRGERGLLEPGLDALRELTGRAVFGVLPWLDEAWLDSEDALAMAGWATQSDTATLRVAAVGLPRVSNATDLDPIAAEPGVSVTVTADPDVLATADLVVLPGTRATLSDLRWLTGLGLDRVLRERVAAGAPVLGICGGYQMLAETIVDGVESSEDRASGLGLLPVDVVFSTEKSLGRPAGSWRGHPVSGYEIHHGTPRRPRGAVEPFLDGWRRGALWATMWHGVFECDAFRRAWLGEVAAQAGARWVPSSAPGFAARREAMLDRIADAVERHLDTAALLRLIEDGVPGGLPWVRVHHGS